MAHNLRNLDLNLLVSLDALLSECHVSRAADKLGLSQPAMSRMLGKLRDMFADPLLVRGQGGLVLTERAQELLPRLNNILEQTQQILEATDFDPARTDRQFHLRATPYGMQTYLPTVVKRFCEVAPNASLKVAELDAFSLRQDRAPESDLAIVPDVISVPESYISKTLGADHFICVMAGDHPLAGAELTLEAYVAYRHVQVTMGGGPHTPVDDMLANLGKTRVRSLFVPNAAAGLAMLPGTDLLMTQTSRLAVPLAKQFGLVTKTLPFELEPATYRMAWHPVHHHHEAHRWFRKLVYTEIRQVLEGG